LTGTSRCSAFALKKGRKFTDYNSNTLPTGTVQTPIQQDTHESTTLPFARFSNSMSSLINPARTLGVMDSAWKIRLPRSFQICHMIYTYREISFLLCSSIFPRLILFHHPQTVFDDAAARTALGCVTMNCIHTFLAYGHCSAKCLAVSNS
jgi:hypothetical protein